MDPLAQRQITSFFANAAKKEKLNDGMILKGMFLSDDVSGVEDAGPATESTSYPTRKRKTLSDNMIDLEDFGPTASTANPPKRQRRQTAKEKAEEEKAAASNVQESYPEPRGQPEVWADVGHVPWLYRSSTDLQLGPPEFVRVAAILSGFQVCRIHRVRAWVWLAIRQ